MFENMSLSTNSATPSSRTLVSAYATPNVFILLLPPVALIVVASLMDMTTGDDSRLELAKRRSSTAWRLPGEAFREREAKENGKRVDIVYLLVQLEFRTFFALSRLWCPYFYAQLLRRQGFAKQHLGNRSFQRDAWQTRPTQILDHCIRMIYVLGNICGIRPICRIERIRSGSMEEPECASFWRLGGKFMKERDESGVSGLIYRVLLNILFFPVHVRGNRT
jgi:hypothetical protein